ncbi:hypothetical protein, partial [Plasmodium yoelii yoelii]
TNKKNYACSEYIYYYIYISHDLKT